MSPSATTIVLYLVFAVGAAAVFFLLPAGGRSRPGVATVFGLSALGALIAFLATRGIGGAEGVGYFFVFAIVALVAAARVVTHTRPVYSALYFVLVVVAVAALLVLSHAEFLAVALIIIYAGAILVTYLFVIMLAQQPGSPMYDRRAREPLLAVLASFTLMAAIAGRLVENPPVTVPHSAQAAATKGTDSRLGDGANGAGTRGQLTARPVADVPLPGAAPRGNSLEIGTIVMTRHVVTLQLAGVLLLVSMVGAIAMSRRKVDSEGWMPPRAPLGQAGREVKPF